MSNNPILYLVIPCYNEEEILPLTREKLEEKMNALIAADNISRESKIVLVNDGSKDKTWELISAAHNENPMFVGINLSRNKGHQNALLAGLMYAKDHCEISISMDADLQDDINVIDKMVEQYKTGSDIVYGVRSSREKDTFFKKYTAEGFYKLMEKMDIEIVFNHADCRLMSRRALIALSEYKEINLFLRGIVPQLGYKTSIAYYERQERTAGTSKYPLKKMLQFAAEGITSFSVKPLRFILLIGIILSCLSVASLIVSLILDIRTFIIITVVGILGGVQIICLGIVGEYIGKIYSETKQRPRYIIKDILD